MSFQSCRVQQDGSTGVCCSRPQLPPGVNNVQYNTAPSNVYPTTSPVTPAQQYYTPKPSIANNPFLSGLQGRLPVPQQRPAPGYPQPNPYTAKQPNAITGRETKGFPDYPGKLSTPLPDIDVRQRPRRPNRPAPGYPQPEAQASTLAPEITSLTPQASNLPSQDYLPSQGYARPVPQASTLAPEVTNLTPQASNLPSQQYLPQSYSRPLPDSNRRDEEPTVASSTITTISVRPEETNDISEPTPRPEEVTPIASPESEAPILIPSSARPKARGPAPGYPFLAPTTEAPSIVRSTPEPAPLATPEPGKECGVRRGVPRPNGPAGLETGFGEFPWHAQVVSSNDQSPLCGAAILSEKVVVTAAHCVDE